MGLERRVQHSPRGNWADLWHLLHTGMSMAKSSLLLVMIEILIAVLQFLHAISGMERLLLARTRKLSVSLLALENSLPARVKKFLVQWNQEKLSHFFLLDTFKVWKSSQSEHAANLTTVWRISRLSSGSDAAESLESVWSTWRAVCRMKWEDDWNQVDAFVSKLSGKRPAKLG